MSLNKTISTFYKIMSDMDKEKTVNLKRVIAAKRKKFCQAIGATEELEKIADVPIEDENLPTGLFGIMSEHVEHTNFDDSIVINDFENIKKPDFDLKTYVFCVKNLYTAYLNDERLCYLLCHARDFNNPQNNLFMFSNHGETDIFPSVLKASEPTNQQSPFTVKLMALMDELLVEYNESKYQQLNLNVTYLILLMARKLKSATSFVNALQNSKTNQDYYKLCPQPLSETLPNDEPLLKNEIVSHKQLMTLILYAYCRSSRLTKRILLSTCLAHLEFTGLGLPKMFDQIVKLYGVSEVCLWDALCVKDKHEAMTALADFHYSQYEGEKEDPPKTYTLFPYCRVLSQFYHTDLSCSVNSNSVVCYAMACLIDKKIGVDKSFVRKSKWAEKLIPLVRNRGEIIAGHVYTKITNGSTVS